MSPPVDAAETEAHDVSAGESAAQNVQPDAHAEQAEDHAVASDTPEQTGAPAQADAGAVAEAAQAAQQAAAAALPEARGDVIRPELGKSVQPPHVYVLPRR